MRRLVMFTPGHEEPGGAQFRSRLVATGLSDRGWQVRAITRAGTFHRFRVRRSSLLTVVEVPGFNLRLVGGALYLCCAIPLGLWWGLRARVFLAIQLTSPCTAAAVCAGILRRSYLAFSTTTGQLSEVAYVLSGPTASLRRKLLAGAAFLVAQTPEAAQDLEALVPNDRIAVVPNPVPSVDPPPLSGQPRALYTGRFSEEKDLPRLLEVWRTIADEEPAAVLTLVGAGGRYRSIEPLLRRMVSEDPVLERSVRITGWVQDVGRYLREADVYVFPSLSEGMSNALLEACAWRRVVVASDIPSNRAVLGDDYPLLYPAGDSDGLLSSVRKAFRDEPIRVEALRHLEARREAFSVDTVISQIEQLVHAADRSRN